MTLTPRRLPIGPLVDATPAERPGPVVLEGRLCRIEKLDPVTHGDALWDAVAGDDRLWTYMAFGPFADRATFVAFLAERAELSDPYAYAVVDRASGKAAGVVMLMEIRPGMRVIEMGSVFYGSALQRTPAAIEAQYLMARHVFETLGYRRYEVKCNALHRASRRAALRLGFTFEGVFRQHMIVKGRNRDTAWFAMLDTEWPVVKGALEAWLDPANFDADGREKSPLAARKAALGE